MDFKADGSCDRPPRRVRDNHHHHHPPSLGSASASGQAVSSAPCGACKFLRRKCVEGCMFAPYFGTEQGAARFAAVHKVFGASNVSKLLTHIPAPRRHDAVVTICYEAQARLADPVYGCVATILALQQQVASLQAELALVQSQLINSKLAIAAALQGLPSQCSHPPQHITVLQPSYSNNSSSSNSLANLSAFQPSALDLSDADPASGGFETLQLSQPSQDEDEAEGDSQNSIVFANGFFHQK